MMFNQWNINFLMENCRKRSIFKRRDHFREMNKPFQYFSKNESLTEKIIVKT